MASVENYVKYASKQGQFRAGAVSATNPKQNLVDLEIPANSGTYDLSLTYVEIVMRPSLSTAAPLVDNTASGDSTGVSDGHLYYNEDSDAQGAGGDGDYSKVVHPSTAILVKSAQMVSSLRGRVASVRNCNVLRANLGVYEKDFSGRNDDHAGLSHSRQEKDFVLGNLAELCGKGDDPSQDRAHGIKIMLKDIFNFGMVSDYDSAKYGSLQIHLELDLQKIGWRDDSLGTGGGSATAVLARRAYGDGSLHTMGAMTQLTAVNCGLGTNTIRTSALYDAMGDHPYYVGQKLTATFTEGGGAAGITPKVIKIKSLTHVSGDAVQTEDLKVDIELDRTAGNLLVPALTGGHTMDITLSHVAPTLGVIAVDSIDLVATQVPGEGAGQHSYSEFALVEDHLAANTASFDRTYHIPPNCVSCLVTFPSPIYSHDSIASYRVAIDNSQLTTRDVVADSALHRDLIKKAFANIPNMQLRDLNEFVVTEDAVSSAEASYKPVKSIMFPVPLSSSQQMLDLSVEAVAGQTFSPKINIFFQQLKSL